MPELYMIIARKNIFPKFGGGGTCPFLLPSLTPVLFTIRISTIAN